MDKQFSIKNIYMTNQILNNNDNTKDKHMLKVFLLERNQDVSGISGTGIVAEGCLFETGEAVVHWFGAHSSINIYKSLDDILHVHGHNGATKVVFRD
jgi:hypothetical protein